MNTTPETPAAKTETWRLIADRLAKVTYGEECALADLHFYTAEGRGADVGFLAELLDAVASHAGAVYALNRIMDEGTGRDLDAVHSAAVDVEDEFAYGGDHPEYARAATKAAEWVREIASDEVAAWVAGQ